MPTIIEPLKGKKKLSAYLTEYYQVKNVLLFLWHGLGDMIMFMHPFERLKELYPDVHFDLALPLGLGQEEIYPEAILVEAGETKDFSGERFKKYDLVARINMPMNEGQREYTKGEFCCIHELGIEPVWGHNSLPVYESRLVGLHFNITCLPDSANADEAVARLIWTEVLEAGYIPIESHFEHTFHNPVNKKFDFIDCSVRRVKPRISTLIGLLRAYKAFIGVVSGNFHTALATMHPKQIMLLEKDFKLECFTKHEIARVDLRNYKEGCVKQFLEGI